MVKMDNLRVPCFAQLATGCKILTTECEGIEGCPFYKPVDCEDWMRVERHGEEWLIPPEEYYGEEEILANRLRHIYRSDKQVFRKGDVIEFIVSQPQAGGTQDR